MDYGTILIIQYIIVVPTAIYALFFMPKRRELATPLENLRRNSAIIGLLPCGVLGIFIALVGAGIYYLVAQAAIKKEIEVQGRYAPTKVTDAGSNPFGISSPQRTTSAGSGNPFSGGAGARPQGGRDTNESNPFS